MAAPSIIENDKGTPTYISPTARQNLAARVGNKPIPVNIGTTTTGNLPMNQEYLQGYAYNRLELDAKTPEQYQYQAQSSWDAFKNGLTQLGAEAILGTVKSAATLLDLPQYVNIAMNKEKEFNTVFGDYIDELAEGVRENNPVFGTEEVELANPKFWASLLPDLGTTVSLFVPTAGAVKGLSLITKGIIGANKAGGLAGKVANHMLKNRETYKGVGAAMISRTMESSLEAEGTLKESYEKYLSEGYGDEQAKQMAGEDARNTYVANLPLVLLDAVQYTSLYKGMFNPLRGARAAERALANTTSNAILKAARGVYKAGKAVSGIAMESGEELLQFGIQKEASKTDSSVNTLLDAISNLPNYVSDPEAQKAMISGAFGGGVFEGLSYAQRKLFKKDAEIDNDLEAGRIAGAHYKSMKTFMDIIDEDRLKEEKLINEGKLNQYIPKADSFLEAAKLDTDSFTPEDIDNLTKLKDNYYTKLKDYTNKGFSGDMLNKIVEEDMKATIFSNLEEKLKATKPNSPQLTDKELRLKALNLLEEMESGNTNLMKSSKLKSAEIIKEVRKEKALLLAEMQADSTTFDPVKLNRKIKPDSKYREALTVQSNIETAKILANIANNKLEEYNNPDKLIDDIEIDKIIDNYENLVDYKDKFTNFDDYLDYLDKLSNEGDEDLNLVINTIYDDLIKDALANKEEINPKLIAKVKDTDLLEFNKNNLAADPNAEYSSVVSTPINAEQSNIYLTGKKDMASGLVLEDKTSKKKILVLSKDKKGVKILRNNKVETVSEDSLNNTTRLGTYRTADVSNNKYIVTPKSLINVDNGSVKTNFNNLIDAIEFRRATLGIFSTSSIAKIEEDRKNELQNSDLKIRDAEKLYPTGDLVIIAKDEKVTIHKKTLGIKPSELKEDGLYTFKFVKNGKDVIDRVFRYYAKEGLVKQIKTNGTLSDDPNYKRINDRENYISYQELDYADKSERDFKNISLINKKYDEKYVEEVANSNISIESALELLPKFNSKPHNAVIKALEDKIDLNENYDIRTELNKNLKDVDSNSKTVNTLLLERERLTAEGLELLESFTPEELEKEFKDIISDDYEPIVIPEGKAIPITLNDGSKLQLTSGTGIVFLRNKKTNKIKLSVLSFENEDNELIRLSIGQAFVEKVLGIPVYDASVVVMDDSDTTETDVSLLSIFTYDNTKMPYNSGYDYINSNTGLSDKDSKIEDLKNKYETLNNVIKDLIDKGQTTVEQLANTIKTGLSAIDKNTDVNLTNERNKLNEQLNLLTSNSNIKDLVVVNKSDLIKARQVSLDFTSTTIQNDKVADIERRKQENLEDTGDPFDYVSKQPRTDGRFNAFYITTKEAAIFDSYQEAVDWINAKYNTELAALGTIESNIKQKYKGKFIYATPGSGKTTIAKELDDVIDTDDLMLDVMSELHPEFVKGENDTVQEFILDYVERYKNKDEVNELVYIKVQDLLSQGKTVLTGTIAFLNRVDTAFSVDNKFVKDRLKDSLPYFKQKEAESKVVEITDLKTELLDTTTKSKEKSARVKETDINKNSFFVMDGKVNQYAGFNVLIGKQEVPANVDANNNVTVDGKLPTKNNIVKILNRYNEIDIDAYDSKLPLVLNNELKGSVIYMDEVTMDLFFKGNKEDDVVTDVENIKNSLRDIGVYFYDDILNANPDTVDTAVKEILATNQAVIKVLNTENPEPIDGVKSKMFRVNPKTLLDFTLDKNSIDNIKDAQPYVKQVNDFTTSLKEAPSSEVDNYNDLVGKLFTTTPFTEIRESFSNLIVLLNTKLQNYVKKYEKFSLEPVVEVPGDNGDNIIEEEDTYMQSDLYKTESRDPNKAYSTFSTELKVSEEAENWLKLFNQYKDTNYTIEDLSKKYLSAKVKSIVKYLYVNANTVIGFININGEDVPIGLLDTIERVKQKKIRYGTTDIVPTYLENLWNDINEQNLIPGGIVTSEKDFVVNDIHYNGLHLQRTNIGNLITHPKFSDFAIVKLRSNNFDVVYGNKEIKSNDITNYNAIVSNNDANSHWYITVKVAENKYRLYEIRIDDLSHNEKFIKDNLERFKTDNKFIDNNFFHFTAIKNEVKKLKDKDNYQEEMLNFLLSETNSLKNVVTPNQGLWSNGENVNAINVNIGTHGFLNTQFIVNSVQKSDVKIKRRTRGIIDKRSRAKGLVTRKLSRENALNNLKRILPEGYDVRFYENLIKEGNDYLWGYVSKNIIGLSDQGRIGEEYHEAFHVVFNAFINQTERERLLNHVKNYYKSRIDNSYTEEQLNDPDFAEELLADLYRDFALAYDEQGNKSLLDWIKDIPNAIIRFFKRLFNLETSIQRDKQKLDKFFKSISTGKFTNKNAEFINSFKASKATTYKNGTEKQQIVNMLSGLAAQKNVYDLAKPETIINDDFLKPEKSVLTNLANPKSLINVFINELNKKLQLSEDEGGFIMNDEKLDVIKRVVRGLRTDLNVENIDNVLTITKLEMTPKFGEIPSSMMATFAEHGYMISDIDIENISEIEFDDSDENELQQAIEDEDLISEEEANQKENYQIKNYINPPHLKVRGVAKSFLSLIQKDEVDMFGFNINFNYSPQEAANKFLLAFGNTDDPIQLKNKIYNRYKTEESKPEEFRDNFYMDLYDLIEEQEIMPKEKVYNSLWDTLGKLAKADFFNIVITPTVDDVKISRTMANLDDIKYKVRNKLYNIADIKEKFADQRSNLPSNANLVIQFTNTINVEELNAAELFEDLSNTNKKAIVALMNYLGYNDSFESENYTSIYSLDFKGDLVPFVKLASSLNSVNRNAEITKYRPLTDRVGSKLPSDISSTHKTIDGKLYYEWQVPNAVNRTVKELNKPFNEREIIKDRLYTDLPLMKLKSNFKYEESNGTIDKLSGENKEVGDYKAKDLLIEIIMAAQNGSFVTPVLSDSGRQVYIGGINFLSYDDALNNLLKVALIENNRRLTEGDESFKNYSLNQNNFYNFSTIDPKFFPTEITNFDNYDISNYSELKNEIEKLINQRTEEFVKTLNKEFISLSNDNVITNSILKSLSSFEEKAKTLYTNHILNHIQLTYILIGDPAYYKNYENIVKRAKQMISPSSISNIYNTFDIEISDRNYYDTDSRITVSQDMTVSIKADVIRKSLNDEQLKALGLGKEYENNNLTDGFTVIDDIAYRNRLIAENTFTQLHQDYMDMSMNGFPASKLTIEKAKQSGKSIEDIKKQSPVEVLKPFYYAMINYIKNGRDYLVPFQKKDSEFKISPFYGLKTINGIKNSMYNSYYYKLLTEEFGYTIEQEVVVNGEVEKKHIIGFNRKNRKADVVSFESAIKVFTDTEHIQKIDQPFDKTKVITVPFKHWGRQVETPKGHFNKDNTFGTQIRKLVVSRIAGKDVRIKRQDGTTNTPDELLKEYNQLLIEDIKRGEKRFMKSIKTNGAIDGKKILNLIKAEFLSRKKPLQYLEALELLNSGDTYDELITRIPISHPFHTLQIQTILNSLHRNKVNKLKFKNGFKLVNASSVGFERQPQIVFNNPANPKEGIKHFEVYAPIHDNRLYEFVDEGSGLIPEERMSEIETKYPGILDGVVYRIPTEEKYSMYKIKIIGFVVDEVGAIFMPDVVTTRSGLDFDIDKMFGFFKDSKVTTIDGKDYIGLTREQYAKRSKYDINSFEFNEDYNDYQAQVISDNAKLDIMMDVLSSEHTVISQMKPGSFEAMEQHALELEYITILKEGHTNNLGVKVPYKYKEFKEELDKFKLLSKSVKSDKVKSKTEFWNIVNISNTINKMNLGKKVLGLAANYNAMSAIVENKTIIETPVEVIIKDKEGDIKQDITYNKKNLSKNPTSLFDLDNNLKYENTSMLVAGSADNGATPTLEPLGFDLKSFNLYMALTGYGFPRRMIEKLLAINNIPDVMTDVKVPEVLDTDITEDKLEFVLFNHKAPEVQPILYTLNQLLKSKRTRTIGSNMSQLLKHLKTGDSGLQSNTFENMMTSLDYNDYVKELEKKNRINYRSIIGDVESFSYESTKKMFEGLDIVTDITKIPIKFGAILRKYNIKPEYYLDFYSAVYAYITRNEYEAFMSPQQVTDPKLKDKKIQSILNSVNHLKDFQESFPDNLFLKQLSLNDNNKIIFTEQRKKDDSLINTTINDFENLLNSDEVVEVKDKYDGKFVSIKVSDFANDLAYYTIQAYGFSYNYQSFSYVIPPAYYDNHRGYVENVDKKMKEYIANNNMFNNIFIEYALNNPKNIEDVGTLPLDLSQMVNNLVEFGSFAYQPIDNGKSSFNNIFLFNNKSFIKLENEIFENKTPDLIYRVGDETIVKVFEKNNESFFIIANINNPDNIDYITLNNTLEGVTKLHYPNETRSKQNKLKDYGLFTQEFYLKSFNKEGIEFEPKATKEVVEKGTDTPELTTVLNTEVLSITNISEGKSEIIRLLSDISNNTASSIEDVINDNTAYDNKLLENYTNVTFDKTTNNITITERNYLEQEDQQTLSDVIPMLKEVLNDYNKNKQVEVETPTQQIYSQLGNKTQSENVVIVNIKTKDGKYDRDANFKEAKANNRIYSMEINSDLSFSNPWASFERKGTIKTNTTKEAVINYIDWLTTDKFKNVKPERRKWILDILKSGQLKNRPIQYYAELKEPSHTTALDYLINKYDWNKQSESQTTIIEPKGEKVADGIYVNQESLTKEEQLELFDYLKPFLESQGKKTNKGANAPIMIGLGLRWDYKSNNPNLTPVNVGNNLAGRNTSYAYYNLSINGKPLGKITQRFIELMNKSTGIDISNYDGAIINLYTNESFIGNHSDLEESATAEKYPVVVANIGGSGNIILGTDKNQIKVDLKSGTSYLFGFKGKNRKIPHSTYASDVKGFLPNITISQEGKTFNTGSYRVSITMRRVMPLELGMPSEPIIISNINQQPKSQTEINIYDGTNENAELSNFYIRPFELSKNLLDFLNKQGSDYSGINYKSVEQAFQNIKVSYNNTGFSDTLDKDILSTTDGGELRRLGRKIDLDVTKWNKDSSYIMKELMLQSFRKNPNALAKLLATGNATLTHKYKGEEQDNGRFSKILMEVRDELRGTTQQDTNDYETGNGFNSNNCLT
jgi:predicted NAD-dependent protein-ADP-ribosyltransferase YbiA (DUF1768 family)